MPYIGNVITSFAVETGSINDQAVTAPKLSATGGTDGQILALDSNLNLAWVSDPAGQWVTSGTDLNYTAGDVGIGTSSPDALLHVSGADTAIIRLENSDTSLIADQIIGGLEFEKRDPSGAGAGVVGGLRMYSKGSVGESVYLTLSTSGSSTNDVEALRIDAAGRLLVGAEDSTDQNAKIQVGTTVREILEGFNYANDALGSRLRLAKSRNTSIGSQTIVQDDDELGLIAFSGSDGTNYRNAALIRGFVDGTPGSGDMPGRLVFSTTADGSSSPTERMRIDSSGRLLVGTASAVDTSDEAVVHIVDTLGARLVLGRNDTTVADGNGLGGIRFAGNDTTSNTFTTLGEILCQADGTHAAGDNPTRLTFKTTSDGASSVTERMRIDSDGRLLVGSTTNQYTDAQLQVASDSGSTLFVYNTDVSATGQARLALGPSNKITGAQIKCIAIEDFSVSANRTAELAFETRKDGTLSEQMRIDSSGRLLVGTDTSVAPNRLFQVSGSNMSICANTSDNDGVTVDYIKSRNTSYGSNTVVQSGDTIAKIQFRGDDGSDYLTQAAQIKAEVDGTPGSNDMPGRLVFLTTADGASTPTERLRIDSSGRLLVGVTSSVSAGSSASAILQVEHAGGNVTGSFYCTADTTQGGTLVLGHGRGSATGVLQDDDTIGDIRFAAADGTDLQTQGARIAAEVDGTPGSNDMPARLLFSTCSDGQSSPTERMRIDSSGRIGFGGEFDLTASNRISINPTDGLIGLGMDGRDSYVTSTSGCYIYSGSGASGTTLAGELILQSRSNVTRSIKFITGSTPDERARIDNDGLKFSGDTAAANALNDYEEGTHETTVTMSGDTSFSYSARTLAYTKIGRLVIVTGRLFLTGTGGTTFEFTLPFTSGSGNQFETSNEMQNIRANDGYTFRINPNTSSARLQNDGSTVGIGTNSPHINVNLSYFTA